MAELVRDIRSSYGYIGGDFQTFILDIGSVGYDAFIKEPTNSRSNYWLQAVILDDIKKRDQFLEFTNQNGIMTRPVWKLMNGLDMFKDCQSDDLINITSSVIV